MDPAYSQSGMPGRVKCPRARFLADQRRFPPLSSPSSLNRPRLAHAALQKCPPVTPHTPRAATEHGVCTRESSLEDVQGFGFRLRVPAQEQGAYYLTITELGHVDNVFTYSWRYRLTATTE